MKTRGVAQPGSAPALGAGGLPSKHQSTCINSANETEASYCPTCGGEMCPHDICSANWCGMDHHCTECADREWREIEAEDEARYWDHPGWKEVFEGK